MDDISTLLFLLLIIIIFIVLFAIIKFIIIERRSFTFEIISIPLGIFKFDKRDELIKKLRSDNKNDNINEGSIEDKANDNIQEEECLEGDTFNDGQNIKIDSSDSDDCIEKTDEKNEVIIEDIKSDNDVKSDYIPEKPKQIIIQEDEVEEPVGEDVVYWTANGKAYHVSRNCRTLARSKAVFSGTVDECGRHQKCIHCQ